LAGWCVLITWSALGGGWWGITRWQAAAWLKPRHRAASGGICRTRSVMILGRLAVDRAWQGRDLGRSALRDAVLRILQAAKIGGIRAILVHAISEDAKRFYQRYGFGESPADPMTLMMAVADAEKALTGK